MLPPHPAELAQVLKTPCITVRGNEAADAVAKMAMSEVNITPLPFPLSTSDGHSGFFQRIESFVLVHTNIFFEVVPHILFIAFII